jgi:hypothetical protein
MWIQCTEIKIDEVGTNNVCVNCGNTATPGSVIQCRCGHADRKILLHMRMHKIGRQAKIYLVKSSNLRI